MSTTEDKQSHHHGNLRPALVAAGIAMLERGERFSLRAVAREVGVSQTAPYRHFPDKAHLEAAMASTGFETMKRRMENVLAHSTPRSQVLTDLAVAYVRFAAENPALYDLMFSISTCGDDRLPASAEVFSLLEGTVAEHYPQADTYGLTTASWSMAHGLASLFLSGQLPVTTPEELDARVTGAFSAILPSAPAGEDA
ncbi:TetR/AcrR family transcriptional regulator [Kocuria sp.]|uniref:TetR/AcrR family transcriptional regulator n=1 Tax=Kocuria sp. TaxID=1871328 RepID=UPI0026DA6F0C|nr:WHG domain-containing protein [Kocuria sp.]MDO4918139.1 WHG domain-containing protein [Kocuria sp.]